MGNKQISRRDFMRIAAAGIAGGTLLPWESVFAGGEPSWPEIGLQKFRIVDPPAGQPFKEPLDMINLSKKAGVVEVEQELIRASVKINGKEANLLTYNGQFPSQTIRIKKGDLLRLRLKNSLKPTRKKNVLGHVKNLTNIHTHGLHVSPSGNADNIFVTIKPGKEFLFEYDTSKQEPGAMCYYHPHYHELVAEQVWAGLSGALVVEDETEVLSGFETHILLLKDISLEGSMPAPHTKQDYWDGKEGEIVMVNGQVNPVLGIRPGQVQRWRIINASTARFYKLKLEDHELYLAGTDGGLLDKPYPLSELLITPGERVDLLVKAGKKPGTFKFLSLPYDRKSNRLEKVTLMTLSSEGKVMEDRLPSSINPHARRVDMDISTLPKRKLYLIMANGRGFVNLKDYNVEPYVLSSSVGTYEIWEIFNISPMDHPFHQHVNPCQILSITGGEAGYASLYSTIPAWKDTINIVPGGSVKMLVPVMNFTGKTVFHCHVSQHEDIGMMGIWEIK